MPIVELKHFDVHKDIRSVCHARHHGLVAVLEQLGPEGWRPISLASRYFKLAEKRYSTSAFEMQAVLWGAEFFRSYGLGLTFKVIADYKALASLLNGNNKKKQNVVQPLKGWLGRLTPIDFQVEHKPGAKTGLADFFIPKFK